MSRKGMDVGVRILCCCRGSPFMDAIGYSRSLSGVPDLPPPTTRNRNFRVVQEVNERMLRRVQLGVEEWEKANTAQQYHPIRLKSSRSDFRICRTEFIVKRPA
jgi:hypothetical protein